MRNPAAFASSARRVPQRTAALARFALAAVLGLMSCSAARAADPARPPNILLVLTDDQGWSSLGCYGGKQVATPHLDRLAGEGVRFEAAYVTPQCTPSRASLLTGQHTARNRMWHVIPWYGLPFARVREPEFREHLPRETFLLSKGLKSAGYATAIVGKWHLTTNSDGDYAKLNASAAVHYGFDYSAPPGPAIPIDDDKQVDHLTDRALEFIERHRERPWFVLLTHHTVHGQVKAPQRLVDKHLGRGAPASGLHNATYLAALEHLDDSIGRLTKRLDALKMRDNTLLLFLSDNGGVDRALRLEPADEPGAAPRLVDERREFSNAPLRAGKGTPYEGGIRVPCLVRWPGVVQPGRVEKSPVHITDWLPTLLAAAGAKPPADHILDGTSLLPLLRGEPLPERALFWYLPLYDLRWGATPCAVVREGRYKLIEHFGDRFDAEGRYRIGGASELYDLSNDLGEAHDLSAADPRRAAHLREKLRNWMRSVPAEIPTANPDFDPQRQWTEVRRKPVPNPK